MACWTTFETRKLVEMHRDRIPTQKELAATFPRHTFASVRSMAWQLDLRRKHRERRWIKIAHVHFAKIEANENAE